MNRRVVILIIDIVIGVLVASALIFAFRGCSAQDLAPITPSRAMSGSVPASKPIAVTGAAHDVVTAADGLELTLTDSGKSSGSTPRLSVIYTGPVRSPVTEGAEVTFYGALDPGKVFRADKYTLR